MNNIPERIKMQVSELFMSLSGDEKQLFLPGGPSEIEKLYSQAASEKRSLRIKLGIDPTSTDLHLGHTVCLHMLRRFQQHGHKPILIIGGFTAMVGDPSGRNEARPPLTYEQVQENAKTYLEQVEKILDLKNIEVVNNYDWLSKITSSEFIKLAHIVTVNQLIGKEAFGTRVENGEPLYLHEVLYPILQGYDSCFVKADVEIGGIDQTFNVLFGRHVQKHFNQNPQLVILNPLLIGLDGKRKMSKSFNNYIALNDAPDEVFGKAMSIPDELILSYFNLTSTLLEEMSSIMEDLKNGKNPRDVKMVLARRLVEQFYGIEEAEKAQENFINQFRLNKVPDEVQEYRWHEPLKITDLMYKANMVPSKGEAKRLIEGGGVKLKSERIDDPNFLVTTEHKNSVLQIGKRKFIRII